jgi:hypothetical protein
MSTWSLTAIEIEIKHYGVLCFFQFCEREGAHLMLRLRVRTGFGMKWQRNALFTEVVDDLCLYQFLERVMYFESSSRSWISMRMASGYDQNAVKKFMLVNDR